ncbi:MAG TPA: archease [Actinomycetota bacterium]
MDDTDAGHRILPHTADVMIEAWAPTRVRCFEEAARAFIETFAEVRDVPATEPVSVGIDAASDIEMLAALLDEIIFLVDVASTIPVHLTLDESDDGGIAGVFDVAPVDALDIIGPLPKGVSHGGEFIEESGMWRCRVVAAV